ncbi:hypothetical protein STEG23_006788, partial [Scotinomys teguina]
MEDAFRNWLPDRQNQRQDKRRKGQSEEPQGRREAVGRQRREEEDVGLSGHLVCVSECTQDSKISTAMATMVVPEGPGQFYWIKQCHCKQGKQYPGSQSYAEKGIFICEQSQDYTAPSYLVMKEQTPGQQIISSGSFPAPPHQSLPSWFQEYGSMSEIQAA